MIRVLVVDDDEDLAALVSAQLGRLGFDARCACSVAQAREHSRGVPFDAVVTDWQLLDGDATDVVHAVPARARLLLAGSEGARPEGFDCVLLKPVATGDLAAAIHSCLEARA